MEEFYAIFTGRLEEAEHLDFNLDRVCVVPIQMLYNPARCQLILSNIWVSQKANAI